MDRTLQRRPARRLAAGISLVELMVAMVISLIGTIIIFQVFEASEGIRRTTTSGGDAQQNGVLGLHFIENDLRNAGMGFNDTSFAGCNVKAFDSTRSSGNQNYDFDLVPVKINGGANPTTPDSLIVFYGSQNIVAGSTTLTANMVLATEPLRVMNRYGFRTGDLLVLMQPGTTNCSLKEVTALPSGQSDQVNHDAVTYQLDWISPPVGVNSRGNPAPGAHVYTGANTANATRVYNIGNLYDNTGTHSLSAPAMPVNNTYQIEPIGLTVRSKFSSDPSTPAADNIVHLRALYGLDDGFDQGGTNIGGAGDTRIDRWVDAATFNALSPVPWNRIVAVRVAVLARSAQPEKPSSGKASDTCDATKVEPTWSGSAWSGTLNTRLALSTDPAVTEWQCYRYRVFETTVPLRNWIWSSS